MRYKGGGTQSHLQWSRRCRRQDGIMQDSLEMRMRYVPAWSFAESSARWAHACSAAAPADFVGEPAFLSVLYSTLSLEALIAQMLADAPPGVQVEDLLEARVSVLRRWREGCERLGTRTPDSVEAVESVRQECLERGSLGLLVRSRNKLVHTRIHTEVFRADGSAIEDEQVDRLVADLREPPASLPATRPSFPNLLQCPAAAAWSRVVLGRMVRLLHRVVEVRLTPEWERVLPPP